jgi:CheY-like chemotaxis protein
LTETILVVEDGEAVRSLVCRMLVQNGYRVLEASSGHQALQLCESHPEPIHLILTDVVMPHMSGGELASRVARTYPELRILFMSAYSEEPVVQRMGRDAVVFLQKPFTSVSLVNKIREVLDAPWNGWPVRERDGG